MYSQAQQAIVATSEAVIVRTNSQMAKMPWLNEERAIIEKFEGRQFDAA